MSRTVLTMRKLPTLREPTPMLCVDNLGEISKRASPLDNALRSRACLVPIQVLHSTSPLAEVGENGAYIFLE